MNKGYGALVIWLLAFFKLLWAKLPGPSQAAGGFRFRRKKGEGLEVFHSDGRVAQFFSAQTTGITVQEVKPLPDRGYIADREPLRSMVEIKITKPDTAELRVLNNPHMEDLLLRGSGQIAIVTGVMKEGRLEVENEFLGKGTGRGTWELQLWKK